MEQFTLPNERLKKQMKEGKRRYGTIENEDDYTHRYKEQMMKDIEEHHKRNDHKASFDRCKDCEKLKIRSKRGPSRQEIADYGDE